MTTPDTAGKLIKYHTDFLNLEDDNSEFFQYHNSSELFDNYYNENHSMDEMNTFESKLANSIACISTFATKNWQNPIRRYCILNNLISFTYYVPNIAGSVFLTSDLVKLLVKELQTNNTFESNDQWSSLLLLTNISFNFDSKTQEMLKNEDIVNIFINKLKMKQEDVEYDIGECELTLIAYNIINLYENEKDLVWLLDTFPNIFDNLCNEWKCALAIKPVYYDDYSYIPGCWMRPFILNKLISETNLDCVKKLIEEQNMFEHLISSLKHKEQMLTKTILLHTNACSVLCTISNYVVFHSYFLEYQYEKGNLMDSLKKIEENEGIAEYKMAKKYCKLIEENIRNPYLRVLKNINVIIELFHDHIIYEIVSFVW